MSPWLIVARREFLERVRTKWFVIVTLLGPLGLVGIFFIPGYLGKKSAERGVVVQIVDESGMGVGEAVVAAGRALGSNFKIETVAPALTDEQLWARVNREEIDGFLRIPPDIVSEGVALYRGDNAASLSFGGELNRLVNSAVFGIRAIRAGLDDNNVRQILAPVSVTMEGSAGASGIGLFIAGYVVMFLLYMAILLYAMNVMRGVIQEKTSRVVEIIISSTKPSSLMLGKIVGVGSVGLAQLSLWSVLALVLINYHGSLLEALGLPSSLSLPALGALDFVVVLAYFLLGFFLYAAIYAAIGALVSSEQEASQLQMPVVLLLIIPVLSVGVLTDDPNGPIASALTQFPFSSPVLMPMRYLLDGATLGEVAVSLVLLCITIAAVVWLAAKIYRLGILLTGKRPSVRAILRWLRHT